MTTRAERERLADKLEDFAPKYDSPMGRTMREAAVALRRSEMERLADGREDTSIGGVTWHSSEEDGGPDVGISLYLGPDDRLWAGEISRRTFDENNNLNFQSDGGWFLVRYTGKEAKIIAKFGELDCQQDGREFIEWIAGALRSLPDAREALGPVAWCQPMDNGKHTPRKFYLYFDDPDHGNGVFDNEVEARAAFERANVAWNCYLFGALPLATPPSLPQAGESERPPECEEAFDRDKLCPHLKETDNRGILYHCDVCEQKLVVPDEAGESREAIIEALDVPRIMEVIRSRWNYEEDQFNAIEQVLSDAPCVRALAAARHRGEAPDA
jgi:hypothetical protein